MDRRLLLGTALCASATLAFAPPARAQPLPNAQPSGGSVMAGAATIGQSSSTTTIVQSTQRAAIKWQSFDVGSQQTVQFQQPSSSSVVLNRVVGPNPSQIAGQIDANGQVVITNQSGVMFYKGSQVNTAGLMVSAAGISKANFMAGRMVFDHAPNPNAKVVNQGSITVRDAGLAALVAPQVANSGVINARLGHVVLAGAQTATLDLYGDGLMAIDVTGQVVTAPNGATALVTNTGIIRADGGTVQLTARAADGVVQTLVDAGGKVQAATVGNRTGTIVLNGVGGSITVAGQLSATGNAPGSVGGNIAVNPSGNVTIASGARVNASGQAGGGVIAIGTTLARAKGGPGVTSRRTAANVTVAAGATIAANATHKGNGGRVAVLSRSDTVLNGTTSARGGPQGGNGGTVETSGNTLTVGPSAVVDTRAPQGLTGTWLIDPMNWVIADTGGDETPTQVVNALEESDVTIAADNDITVTNNIDATTDFYATNSLFFEAGRSILINANITMNGGGFSATANDSSDLGTGLADRLAGPGNFTMAPGTTIDTSVGTEFIAVTVLGSATNTNGGGDFVPGTISLANLTTGGGEVIAGGGTGLGLSGNIDAGFVTLSTTGAGGIALDGAVNATTLSLSASGGGVTQDAAGVITATNFGISSTGSVSLLAANSVTTLAAVVTDSGSSFSFRDDSTALTIGTIGFGEREGDFISGITTNDGQIALSTTTSGSVTANAQISSTGGEIDIAVAPGSGFTNNTDSTLETPTSISSGNGNVVILADSMTLATNSTINAGAGTVVLGPATTSDSISLGTASTTGVLGLQTSDFATITAGMIEVGYRSEDATALFTGNITVGGTAGISLNPADVPVLLLVTGGSSGTVTQTQPVSFSAPGGTLGVIAGGTVTLTGANTVGTFAGFADNGSTLTFDNSGPLTVGALPAQQLGVAVDGTTGIVSSAPMASGTGNPSNPLTGVTATGGGDIAVTTTTGALTLSSNVTAVGETVTLISAGAIDQTGGVITAATLTGSSVGGATLTLGNAVGTLGPFSDTGTGNTIGLSFTDGQALQTSGLVSSTGPLMLTTTTGGLTLGGNVTASGGTVTLTSAGAISQTGGLITAATLMGSSVDGATLTQVNAVGTFGPFSDTGTGNTTGLSFTDGEALLTSGLVSSTGPLALTTTSGALTLGGDVTAVGETVTLTSAGAISQTAGLITAGTLTGSSVDGATLTLVNAVGTLGPFSDTGTGNATGLSFTDGQALRTSGGVSSTGPLTLTTTTGGLTLGGDVTASDETVTLTSAGAISQTAGVVTAATLIGSSIDGAMLTQVNAVGIFGPFSDTGTDNTTGLSFTDGPALRTSGIVSSTGPLALTTTTGGLTLGGDVTAVGETVTLTSAGAISQIAGVITAGTLAGGSVDGATLTQVNAVGTLGPFSDAGTDNTIGLNFTASQALRTSGLVSSTGPLTLTTTTGGVTLGGDVTASGQTVTLTSAGAISQTAGAITAATLTGSSLDGAMLTQVNAVNTLGPFSDTGTDNTTGLSFTDGQALRTSGVVLSTGPLALTTTTGGLTLGGDVTANGQTVTLASAGAISQIAGVISGATVTGSSVDGATLTLVNAVGTLGPFSDTGTGNTTGLSFTDGQALRTSGLVSSTGPLALTTTTGGLTLGGDVTASGQTVTLTSAAAISQTAGVITAATLIGSSLDGATLTQGNAVGTLGHFSDIGTDNTIGLSFTDGQALRTSGVVISTGPLTLTTTAGGLTLGGDVTALGQTVTLASAGAINQTAGVITAATLTGGSVDGATLTQGNAVGTLGPFNDAGTGNTTGLSFTDGQALQTSGLVSSTGPLALTTTTGGLTLGGDVTANGQTVMLTSAGAISQAAGVITAGTLTGSSAGNATLALGNAIGTLGPFTVGGGSLVLYDASGLTIAGPIAADFLTITATGRMTLAGNIATIGAPLAQQSGATPAPGGSTLQVLALETPSGPVAQFVQTGTVMLTDPPGTTLRIQLPATGGTASFAGLAGPGAELVLGLGNGTATGTMQVGGLLVLGAGGTATLVGSVAGVTTQAAAALGQISPAIDPNYTFNDCVIGVGGCGAPPPPPIQLVTPPPIQPVTPPLMQPPLDAFAWFLPGQGLPPVLPLPTLNLIVLPGPPWMTGQLAPQDVVPPNISFEDY